MDDVPVLPFWRMFAGSDGLSGLARADLAGFALQSVGGKAAPMWMREFPGAVTAVKFVVLPVGWRGDWHESPRPQWVVPLSGRWFLETADGARLEMGPGEIHWGEDIGTAGAKGHLSGQVGDVPCAQLLVQFAGGTTAIPRDV